MRTVDSFAFCFLTLAFLFAASPAAAQVSVISGTRPVSAPDIYGGKTVVPALVACTDLPTATVPVPALRILGPHAGDAHAASSRADLVVLSGGTPQGLLIGQRYFTRRLHQPTSKETISDIDLGAIRTTGWLTVVAADERFALARIDYACVSVEAGDYLEPYVEPALPTPAANDGQTNFKDLGHVLFGIDRREMFGAGDVLSIDRGSAQGLVAGTRVAFYRDRHNGTPLVEVGVGVVIEVSTDSSKVVLERTFPDVRLGDYFAIRAAP